MQAHTFYAQFCSSTEKKIMIQHHFKKQIAWNVSFVLSLLDKAGLLCQTTSNIEFGIRQVAFKIDWYQN